MSIWSKLSQFDDENHVRFYIAMDNCIFIDDICSSLFYLLLHLLTFIHFFSPLQDQSMKQCNKTFKCKKHHKSSMKNEKNWDPLLLILPLRLGLNEFNEEYKESVKVIEKLNLNLFKIIKVLTNNNSAVLNWSKWLEWLEENLIRLIIFMVTQVINIF